MKENQPAPKHFIYSKQGWFLAFPLIIYSFFAFKEIALPGLYMDAVNPDYLAAWILRGGHTIPAWIYPDNFFAGQYHYPLLTSLYGGDVSTYLGMLFFSVTGYGLGELRVFHALLGMLVLVSLFWCLKQWRMSSLAITIALGLLAVDPTFLFSWRTQYYLQLVPVMFMATGLGILGRYYQNTQISKKSIASLVFAGILLGFAAYCYFIFAFYAFAIIVTYSLSQSGKRVIISSATALILGAGLGWLPYIYAHLSIILNVGFPAYLDMLHGLQTTYGVMTPHQGGLVERMHIVLQRIDLLVAGHGIQTTIFGDWQGTLYSRIVRAVLLVTGPILCGIYFIARIVRAKSLNAAAERIYPNLLFKIMVAIIAIHMVMGLVVGSALNLQHYVMLLPILCATTAIGLTYLLRGLDLSNRAQWFTRMIILALGSALILFNAYLSSGLSDRLNQSGGSGMYSDAINVAAANIENLSADTALLFPQWGYWMGVVTITGHRHAVYETPSLNDMQTKLNQDSALQKQQSFALVVGGDFLKDGEGQAHQKLAAFAQASGLVIGNITYCLGRNGIDQLWVVHMTRIKAS